MSAHLLVGLTSPQSVTLYWYVVRGSGFVAYILLTTGVLSGLLLSLRWRKASWPRLLTEDIHQFLQLVGLVFLVVHVVTTLLDTFIRFQWYEMLIPFSGPYRVVWMGLGIIAMYLVFALALSIYVRRWIGYRAWRTLHYSSFAAWLLALTHGLATGTDTRTMWSMAVYGVSVAAVVGLLAVRFGGIPLPLGRPPRLRPYVLVGLVVALLLGAVITTTGPLQPGWTAKAGAVPVPTLVSPVRASFRDTLTGMAQAFNEYSLDPGYRMLTLTVDGMGQYPISMKYRVLVKQTSHGIRFVRGLYALAPHTLAWTCSGTVTFHPPDQLESVCRPMPHKQLRMLARVRIDVIGRVFGSLVASTVH